METVAIAFKRQIRFVQAVVVQEIVTGRAYTKHLVNVGWDGLGHRLDAMRPREAHGEQNFVQNAIGVPKHGPSMSAGVERGQQRRTRIDCSVREW